MLKLTRLVMLHMVGSTTPAGVLPSVLVGSPAVATAVLVRDLVQAAALDDPNCFIGLRRFGVFGDPKIKALWGGRSWLYQVCLFLSGEASFWHCLDCPVSPNSEDGLITPL